MGLSKALGDWRRDREGPRRRMTDVGQAAFDSIIRGAARDLDNCARSYLSSRVFEGRRTPAAARPGMPGGPPGPSRSGRGERLDGQRGFPAVPGASPAPGHRRACGSSPETRANWPRTGGASFAGRRPRLAIPGDHGRRSGGFSLATDEIPPRRKRRTAMPRRGGLKAPGRERTSSSRQRVPRGSCRRGSSRRGAWWRRAFRPVPRLSETPRESRLDGLRRSLTSMAEAARGFAALGGGAGSDDHL